MPVRVQKAFADRLRPRWLFLSLGLWTRGAPLAKMALSLLLLPQGMEGRLRPPAYWPPICYEALGRSESLEYVSGAFVICRLSD